ncbi:MAG: AmmeMemoRadiSam system radical SAM enzyme [Spirochaetota bacterium]
MDDRIDPAGDNHRRSPGTGLSRRTFLKACAAGACALCMGGVPGLPKPAGAQTPRKGLIKRRRSPWFSSPANANLRCELCPHQCLIAPGRRGRCGVRENRAGQGNTLVYGNPCLVRMDPVERTPFFHVLPGTRALSVSTAGCPLECTFCEAWDMALAAPEEVYAYDLPPERIMEHAKATRARSVSYAYGEPVAFFEYMADTAALAGKAGLLNLVHTSGYISREPLASVVDMLDAVNIDLKSFEPAFYRDMCGAEPAPVLESMRMLKAAGVHIEITNLVIPTLNDDMNRIREMCLWIRDELGAGVPVHFARFYPLYKLANLPPTPVSTLDRARAVAREAGLEYVYVAKVTGHEGENTFCPRCGRAVIRRMGFVIEEVRLDRGACGWCGEPIPGRWS